MLVVVPTCKSREPIIQGFSLLFNRHWSKDQEVIVLSYDELGILPDNFHVELFTKEVKEDNINQWSTYVKEFAKTLTEPFCLIADDHYLVKNVKPNVFIEGCEIIKRTDISKIYLSHNPKIQFGPTITKNYSGIVVPQVGGWLDPSIWSSELVEKSFELNYTPEQIEGEVGRFCKKYSVYCAGYTRGTAYPHIDCTRHGTRSDKYRGMYNVLSGVTDKDKEIFYRAWKEMGL